MQLVPPWRSEAVPHWSLLPIQGLLATGLGFGVAVWLFPAEATVVAVFIATLASMGSVERILNENARRIFDVEEAPWRANLRTAGQIGLIFLGCVAASIAIAMALPLETTEVLFRAQLVDLGVPDEPFPELHFGSVLTLMRHNLGVGLFFVLVSLSFRHGGAMLAMAWNATVWGGAVGVLAHRWSEAGGPDLPEAATRVLFAIAPHLLLEGVAYVLIAVAAVFASRGFAKHSLDSPIMNSLLRSVMQMLALGLGLLALGALWEGLLGRTMIVLLTP